MPPLRYVACVSWPRSGHHLLVNLLTRYIGPAFSYCEFYNPPTCCRAYPCRKPDITMSKNHDFGLALTPARATPHIIQYRAFAPAIVSDFELHILNGAPNTEAEFRDFADSRIELFQRFLAKWVDDAPDDALIIPYETLIQYPFQTLSEAIQFLQPSVEVDETKARQVIATIQKEEVRNGEIIRTPEHGVSEARRVEDFRFFHPEYFANLARQTNPALRPPPI